MNCAGVGLVKAIPDVSEAEWDRVFQTNLRGVFLMCKHCIPKMQNGGSIVNISSNAGILPRTHDPVYSSSKGALNYFSRALALCHAPDKIRVNCICPGPVADTRIMNNDLAHVKTDEEKHKIAMSFIVKSPLAYAHRRMITPTEVAQAVLYFASDASMMVTGTALAIDGAKSIGVPKL